MLRNRQRRLLGNPFSEKAFQVVALRATASLGSPCALIQGLSALRRFSEWHFFGAFVLALTLTAGLATAQPAGVSIDAAAVAVVPFRNVSGQSADAWIGDGIAETMSVDLRKRGFRVIEQTTVNDALETRGVPPTEGRTQTTLLELSRQLGADLFVSGSYQRSGDALRVIIRLVSVPSGEILARGQVDGVVTSLFQLQDRVVRLVVERLADVGAPTAEAPPRRKSRPGSAERVAATASGWGPGAVTGAIALPLDAVDDQVTRPSPVRRAGGGFAVAGRPSTTVVRTTEPPTIDGRLDDAVWRDVVPITQFVQTSPSEGAPATEDTEVWLAYDSDNLYVAFYAHYTDPGIMRANRAERDQTGGDDQMSVMFDPFLDQQRAYLFSVNAFGVPGDSIVNASGGSGRSRSSVGRTSGGSTTGSSSSGRGSIGSSSSGFGIRGDRSWDALFEVRGGLVEDGWMAEMAIPFKSIRYPARSDGEPRQWGFQISRNIRDKSESLVWSPVSRNIAGQLTQMGILDGLTDLSTSRNLELLPTFTGLQVGSLDLQSANFDESDPLGEVGVGVKYGVTSNLTLDFTYNPDFSQIESDRPQVEINQRFALYFAEQRPFFLEGQEIFRTATPTNLVHTRTIVDPRYGAKVTGKIGRTSVGVFVADDEAAGRVDGVSDPSFGRTAQSLIGRLRYDLYGDSYVGAIATAREFGDDYNRVGGVDGRFRLGRTHAVSFTAVNSEHRDSTDGDLGGPVIEADFTRQARNLSYAVSHSRIDPNFRTVTGFVPRVDIQRTDANVQYRWWPEGTIINWGPSFTYLRNHNHDGVLEDEHIRGNVNFEFVRNVRFDAGVSRDLERFGGIDFRKTGASFSTLVSSRIFSVNVSANQGDGVFFGDNPFLGRSVDGTVSLYFRPTSRLRTELRTVFSRFTNPADDAEVFDVKIYRWRATYQVTDRLLFRHILEHNTLSGTLGNNVLMTYRVNAGTVAFLGYDDRYQQGDLITGAFFPTAGLERTNRAFFTKIAYLFRY